MKIVFCLFFMFCSFAALSSTKNCSKLYKKKYSKIKAYTLVKVLESQTLCSFHVTYSQNEDTGEIFKGKSIYDQIILSKNSKANVAAEAVLARGDFDVCEHHGRRRAV